MIRRLAFSKGHATQNDFVLIDDRHGMHQITQADVIALCDRRAGIGADGLLRVVRAHHIPQWDGNPELWFMDYRNADGSIAEMCGNGLRLFARYLINEQLVPDGDFEVATRAGVKQVKLARGGMISANLGQVSLDAEPVEVRHHGQSWPAVAVNVGNPHAVVFVSAAELVQLRLDKAPKWRPKQRFPEGVNVEFVVETAPGKLELRVFERGSGETMSCGTGVVAAAAAHRQRTGHAGEIVVTVPGGQLIVEFTDEGAWLTGPAVMVARGEYWSG